jgi:hypothetical protein
MKKLQKKGIAVLSAVMAAALLCCGCASTASDNAVSVNEDGSIQIGNSLLVEPLDSELKISEQLDALAADGLYYATWTIGEPVDYENSDGDTVDLYDAQLYLLLGEYRTEEKAADNLSTWLAAANENYEVLSEEDVVFDSVTYHVISYNCTSETNPYDHGISAFASNGKNAVCAELTCQADFADDLDAIMMDFLKHCTYL